MPRFAKRGEKPAGDEGRAAHGDLVREVPGEGERPAARGEAGVGVEGDALPSRVYPRVRAAGAADLAHGGIDRAQRAEELAGHGALRGLEREPGEGTAVVGHGEQDAASGGAPGRARGWAPAVLCHRHPPAPPAPLPVPLPPVPLPPAPLPPVPLLAPLPPPPVTTTELHVSMALPLEWVTTSCAQAP